MSTYTTQELFNHCISSFSYKDGMLISKHWNRPVGSLNDKGYITITTRINNTTTKHLAHRLIFLMHHGRLPNVLDHINGIRTDNRIDNLREATRAQNSYNTRARGGSSSLKGVTWHSRNKKWAAQIGFQRKMIHLGYFDCQEDAHEAYKAAALRLHGEFARLD